MTEEADRSINAEGIDSSKSIEFCLCDANLEYVRIHATAKISDSCFDVSAINHVQCDHSFGGAFTSYHDYVFDLINSTKFYQSLADSSDLFLMSQLIKQQFGNPDGLMRLEEYCKEKEIEYHYSYRSEE